MGLFSQNRSDGIRVKGGDPMMHIMPYMMRSRTESVIYYKKTVPVENINRFIIDNRRDGKRITLFNVVIAALLHTVHMRPSLNRYVAGRRLYSHKNFEALYVVKQSLTDDGTESVAKVALSEGDNVYDIAKTMAKHTEAIKRGELKDDDKIIRTFVKAPRFVIRMVAGIFRFLDFHGILPNDLLNSLPFFSTIFVSHLGSLGFDAPFHHLYEFGTNSIFLVIGKAYDAPYKGDDGTTIWKKSIDLSFTIDERICDGYYLIKSLKLLDVYLQHPELLTYSPDKNIDPLKPKTWPDEIRKYYSSEFADGQD